MTILGYLQDLNRKGYTVIPAEITIQDVLNLLDVQVPEAQPIDLSTATPEEQQAWFESVDEFPF